MSRVVLQPALLPFCSASVAPEPVPRRSRTLAPAAVALALALTAMSASAHRPWLLPSSSIVEGKTAVVSIDAAISEDLFAFDSFPLQVNDLVVVAPDGARVPTSDRSAAKRRVSFDVTLPQKGTYRVLGINDSAFASYKVNGEMKRWRGTIEQLPTALPADAQEVRATRMFGRVETFVTNDTPSAVAAAASPVGLSLQPLGSPTDIGAGETTRFVLTLDGRPLPDADITVIRGGNRYRYKMGEIALKTGADGSFAVTWPEAGQYWLGASKGGRQGPGEAPSAQAGTAQDPTRRDTYSATFEVLPR